MENVTRRDLKISGIGSAAGGFYNSVKIDGQGSVNGDLDCVDFTINGVATLHGNVKAETGKVNGKASFKGGVEGNEFIISGRCKIGGNTTVKHLKVEGETSIDGDVAGDKVETKGHLKVNGNCNTEHFVSKGIFNITGLLNAGEIDAEIYWNTSAREIGGERISIRKGNTSGIARIIQSLFSVLTPLGQLTTDSVEGDDIYLEFTRAKVVRGNNVKLGPGCNIDLVEYKNSFETVDRDNVKESIKI